MIKTTKDERSCYDIAHSIVKSLDLTAWSKECDFCECESVCSLAVESIKTALEYERLKADKLREELESLQAKTDSK